MRVILYEDNTAIRDSLSILLEGMPGIELIGAFPNPVSWDRHLRDTQPDVIMMDIEMPGLDGIRATQAIHA